MGKWHVIEKSIYDTETGERVIEATDWHMREDLQKICDNHNSHIAFQEFYCDDYEPSTDVIEWLQEDKEELKKWIERARWHVIEVDKLDAENKALIEQLSITKKLERNAKEREVEVINLSDETEFKNIVNAYLDDGWKILSTACGFLNSESHDFCTSFQAILAKGEVK